MYVCILALPLCSPVFPAKKKHGFSSVFAKRTSKNMEFFQIFGKRMQEAQASKKAGRGNRAWDPCFATPAPRRLRLVERHQIAARYVGTPPPPPKTYVIDVGWGGVRGGAYPLSSSKYPTRRAMSADSHMWIHTRHGISLCCSSINLLAISSNMLLGAGPALTCGSLAGAAWLDDLPSPKLELRPKVPHCSRRIPALNCRRQPDIFRCWKRLAHVISFPSFPRLRLDLCTRPTRPRPTPAGLLATAHTRP